MPTRRRTLRCTRGAPQNRAMSRKRPAPSPAADVVTPSTSRPKPDRVVLDVGGTMFTTSKNTLTMNSAYFQRIFGDNWSSDDDYFLDRDPATFALLLTYMRTGVVELPEHDESLARRVLLEAQFLGVDGFLSAVKAQAYRNLAAEDWEGTDEDAATNFDAEHGGPEDALRKAKLPARFYGRVPAPPQPERKIVQVMPASHDVKIRYYDEYFNSEDVTLSAISLALVENPKVLEHAEVGHTDRYELDAFVANPASWGKVNLATEAYARVGWIELVPKPVNELIAVPEGTLQAEYWKDEKDHAKGIYTNDVHLLQVGSAHPDNPSVTVVKPVDVIQLDSGSCVLKEVTDYTNFKKLL